ncbi:hypothetical protein cypCar_00046794 [Cyprinus carpio]|nr:hypothetical protein cypCar_00046794 [Cyprinus carpio]
MNSLVVFGQSNRSVDLVGGDHGKSSKHRHTGGRVPLHCVDKHPNQQHIVATGGQDGMLYIWDVRQGNTPFSLIEAHSAETLILICFLYSVGSTFSSIKPQSLVYMLRGWISAPLGDDFRVRHEHTPSE